MRFKYKKPREPFVVFTWFPVRTEDTNEFVWFERVWKVKENWNSKWEYYYCKQNWEKENGIGAYQNELDDCMKEEKEDSF